MACAMLSISIDTQFVLWNLNTVFENLAIDYDIEGVFEKMADKFYRISLLLFIRCRILQLSRRVRNYPVIGKFLSMYSDIL